MQRIIQRNIYLNETLNELIAVVEELDTIIFKLRILDEYENVINPLNKSITLYAKRSDNRIISQTNNITTDSEYTTIIVSNEMLSITGIVLFTLELSSGDTQISSSKFGIKIEKAITAYTIDCGCQSDLKNLQLQISSNDNDIADLYSKINSSSSENIQNNLNNLQQQITTNNNNIINLQSEFSTSISNLQTQITNNSDDISSIQNKLNSIVIGDDGLHYVDFQPQINDLQSQIDSNDNDIETIQSDILVNEQDISNIQSKLSNIDNTITDIQNEINEKINTDGLQNQISSNDKDILDLQTKYKNHQEQLLELNYLSKTYIPVESFGIQEGFDVDVDENTKKLQEIIDYCDSSKIIVFPSGNFVFNPINLGTRRNVTIIGSSSPFASFSNKNINDSLDFVDNYTKIYCNGNINETFFKHKSCVLILRNLAFYNVLKDNSGNYTNNEAKKLTLVQHIRTEGAGKNVEKGKVFCTECGFYGFKVVFGSDYTFQHLETEWGSGLTDSTYEYYKQSCVVASRCRFTRNGIGINQSVDARIIDCSFNKNDYAIVFRENSGFSTVSNCRIEWNNYNGIYAEKAHDITISNCEFDCNGWAGLVAKNNTNSNFTNSVFRRNGAKIANADDGSHKLDYTNNVHFYFDRNDNCNIIGLNTLKKASSDVGSAPERPSNCSNFTNNVKCIISLNSLNGCTKGDKIDANKMENNVSCIITNNNNKIDDLEVSSIVSLNKEIEPFIIQATSGRMSRYNDENPLTFVHFSDIHARQDLWNRTLEYVNYYSSYIKFAIHTGDLCNVYQGDGKDLYANGISCAKPVFNCLGNHDIYLDKNGTVNSNRKPAHDLCFSHTDDWGVHFIENSEIPYPMTYYKDYPSSKIRIIVLNFYYDIDIQCSWLSDRLSEAKSLGYHVITFGHQKTNILTSTLDTSFQTLDIMASTTSFKFDAIIGNWIASGGKFIANFAGHEHCDYIGYTSNGVLNICVEAGTDDNYWIDSKRIKDTKTYDCFNIVSVETSTGILKLIRVGNNADHYLREKKVLCYDYINKKIISQ